MSSFIEDYLRDPSQAVASLRELSASQTPEWHRHAEDALIHSQLESGAFRLYEEILA